MVAHPAVIVVGTIPFPIHTPEVTDALPVSIDYPRRSSAKPPAGRAGAVVGECKDGGDDRGLGPRRRSVLFRSESGVQPPGKFHTTPDGFFRP